MCPLVMFSLSDAAASHETYALLSLMHLNKGLYFAPAFTHVRESASKMVEKFTIVGQVL